MAGVICVGEALLDRLGPPGGDATGMPPGASDDRLGGASANVACALARLGTPSAFVGRVGRDAIGAAFAGLFAERGVGATALQWDGERPSRIVLVQRDAGGERSFRGFAGDRGLGFADQALAAAELDLPLSDLLARAMAPTAAAPERRTWLLGGTTTLASPVAAAALALLVERSRAAGLALAVDVNWRPTFWHPEADPEAAPTAEQVQRMRPLLEQASLIKCAAEEARWLFGTGDPEEIAAGLPGRPAVLVTDGGSPLRWWLNGETGVLPAFAVPVVDTTGAGDAFIAGLLHGLWTHPHWPARQQVRFAAACGALVCRGGGAIDPQPDEAQVLAFLQSSAAPF